MKAMGLMLTLLLLLASSAGAQPGSEHLAASAEQRKGIQARTEGRHADSIRHFERAIELSKKLPKLVRMNYMTMNLRFLSESYGLKRDLPGVLATFARWRKLVEKEYGRGAPQNRGRAPPRSHLPTPHGRA